MRFDLEVDVRARCVRCDAERAVPEADRPRLPAIGPDNTVTIEVDEPCRCGAKRVRLTVDVS